MHSPVDQLRPIIRQSRPRAALEVLQQLGWNQERARVEHVLGTPEGYERLLLDGELTAAGTQRPTSDDLWWTGFQQGAQYHMAIVGGKVHWWDFHERCGWSVPWNGDLRPLGQLSPQHFASSGTFRPLSDAQPSTDLPEKPPREYLTDVVRDWWRRFLQHDAPPDLDGAKLQRDFVTLIARLVLIRTIEDVGGRSWLQPGTLGEMASHPRTIERELAKLFQRLQKKINSQVFSDGPEGVPPASAAVSLLGALYETKGRKLDFAAIEFNMIGRFYERVLGDHHALRDTKQRTLVGPQEREVTPISHRRELGQYYTPRPFADYMARKVVLPRVRLARSVGELPRVADIAVGSGELLNSALRAMLSTPEFRRPEAVRSILEDKLVGVDINPTAIQLTALNLLRTAVLLCPEILDAAPAFPRIRGLFEGKADAKIFKQMGKVDVVLTNPPFRGQPDWRTDVKAGRQKKALDSLGGQTNKAGFFVLKAAGVVLPNGAIAIVLPNQFFSSKGNRQLRDKILAAIDPMEIVDNQGARVFDGVNNQPGILFGSVRPHVRLPKVLITRLSPPKVQERSLLATGVDASPGLRRELAPQPIKQQASWLVGSDISVLMRRYGVPTTTLLSLVSEGFSRAPIPSVGPLGDIWTVRCVDGRFRHELSGAEIGEGESQHLRKVAQPKGAPDGGGLSFSSVERRWVLPYECVAGSYVSKGITAWKEIDPFVHTVCQSIVEKSKGHMPLKNRDHEAYREKLAKGEMSYFRLMGLRPKAAFVLVSRMAHIQRGVASWSSWAFGAKEEIIPASGLFAHTESVDRAQLIALLVNTEPVFEQLRLLGTARGSGWTEVSPKTAGQICVPDLREPSVAAVAEVVLREIKGAHENRRTTINFGERMWAI